jgi:hypothetical protein
MALLTGKPVKAFMYQDHEAHIQVHMSAQQDPKMQQLIGQNPQAQAIMGAAAAHLMEHIAFQYRAEIQKQLGMQLPAPPDYDNDMGYLPPQLEVQLSQVSAQAAAQLLQKDQAEAQQKQAQQAQQDPIVQLQQQEMQLKQQEIQMKQQALQLEGQIAQAEQQRKQLESQTNSQIRMAELQLKQKELELTSQLDSVKLGAEIEHNKRKLMTDASHKQDMYQIKEEMHKLREKEVAVNTANTVDKHNLAIDMQRTKVADSLRDHEKTKKEMMVDAAHKADNHDLEEKKHKLTSVQMGVDIAHQNYKNSLDLHKHHSNLTAQAKENEANRKAQSQQEPPTQEE